MPSERPRRVVDPEGKRAAILAAAQDLFATQGYERTIIAAVAERAGVAVGSVPRIFGDKAGLLHAAQAMLEERFIVAMTSGWRSPGPLHDRFRAMFDALFAEMARQIHLMPIMALAAEPTGTTSQQEQGAQLRSAIRALIEEAIERGEFRAVPAEETANITFGMVEAAMQMAFRSPDPASRDRYAKVLADMIFAYVEDRA